MLEKNLIMIFLTVGTLFPFNRLVKSMDRAVASGKITEEIYAQIGPNAYIPQNMESIESLDKKAFDDRIHKCTGLISHAGMGSISMAINHQKPLLVMPRMKKYNEHVNDHQVETALKFESLGHILVANNEVELIGKISEMKTFIPRPRITNIGGIVSRIERFLDLQYETKT
jgi:exopolysaccharide biosynthesis glucuronosyltransferase PssE